MELDLFIESIRKSLNQMNADIEKLYGNSNEQILNHLNREVMILESKLQKFSISNQIIAEEAPPLNPREHSQIINENEVNTTRAITLEELAMSDGKNGNPAYIAVNGFVYDVTNSPAWAAGTHFGLCAGNDLTDEFLSCHTNLKILDKLPVVGFLS